MSEHRYLHSDTKYELELNRLKLVESIYDPTTIFHLEMIGISEGSNCLEIGAGAGSIAQWLSKRVGSTGRMVATDIDMRFLKGITTTNLEVRQHDIARDELEEGEFDLVHCRFVLEHLIEPEKALKKMANAVRPGGWLLIEDSDYSPFLYADVTDSHATFFTKVCKTTFDFLRKRGIAEPFFGRQMRRLMEHVGFANLGHDGWTRIYRGGEPDIRILSEIFQAPSRRMMAAGLLSQEQINNFMNYFMNPNFNLIGPIMFSAWGKRPL